ncbi:T9SS type A sorting domain-containing protein [Aequorivita sp. KMM 9714]|uniref:T9SS type A sorting domain-containing protein n=1 Tax=Aequorivita sp. KMM 9714 TaxID=2707173 RepID=UPI0013EB4F05|nr:T9SS type A sorting domain-containing protein [Aequorivita sp. KMM 9714]NGX83694.1 T9SS type A sorting domain-containing protein [Aequorivita sp. KMM 9714]
MRKTFYLLLIALITLSFSQAQSLSQDVMSSAGATISGASNSLSFTAGEAVIGDISNGESLGQGFWLGAIEGVVLSNEDFTLDVHTTVYPNPVTDYLNISFKDMEGETFDISIFDLNGRLVYNNVLMDSTSNETLNFSGYSSGLYILNIEQRVTKKSKSFKIIKQ